MEQTRDLSAYLHAYLNLPFERVAERFRTRKVRDVLGAIDLKSVLEVGCGVRSLFHELTDDYSGVVVEPIAELLALQDPGPNVELFHGTIDEFASTTDRKFEIVVLSSLLHEVENPIDLLYSAKKCMKQSAKLIVVVPNQHSIHRILGVHRGIASSTTELSDTQSRMQQLHEVFSPKSIVDLLVTAGFCVTAVSTFFPKITNHSNMQQLIDSGRVSDQFLEMMFDLSDVLDPLGSELLAVCELTT